MAKVVALMAKVVALMARAATLMGKVVGRDAPGPCGTGACPARQRR
jgi:hypothetical protein